MEAAHRDALMRKLEDRFAKNPRRHEGLTWAAVRERLLGAPEGLATLGAMEESGGEPDVVGREGEGLVFVDCSPESPAGRRSLCFDGAALASRKENKPRGSALEVAASLGATILTEAQYREVQRLFPFDLKTSSWVWTPPAIRELGGALFCDRRFDHVFVYHNGAESYYAARGFRARLVV